MDEQVGSPCRGACPIQAGCSRGPDGGVSDQRGFGRVAYLYMRLYGESVSLTGTADAFFGIRGDEVHDISCSAKDKLV